MIVVLSPESVASNNVMDEVSYALEENKLVIPVLRKDCSIPFRLRRVQRIDFTADYDTGFADLLRALGIEQPATTQAPIVEDDAESAEEAPSEAPRIEQPPVATKLPEPQKQVAQEVEELPGATPTVTESKPPVPTSIGHKPTWQERMKGALAGAIAGVVIAMIGWLLVSEQFLLGVMSAIPGLIAGAISGTDWKVIKAALVGFAVTVVLFTVIMVLVVIVGLVGEGSMAFALGLGLIGGVNWGLPIGAMVGVILKKTQRPSKKPTPTNADHKLAWQERGKGALAGAAVGVIYAIIAINIGNTPDLSTWLIVPGLLLIFGAIAGAITGTDKRVFIWVIIGTIFSAVLPLGPILGAMVGMILKKRLGWT